MEVFQTRPPDSFFKARDLYDAALYYGELNLTAIEQAVFRYLLENTMYRPRGAGQYGYVTGAALGVESIAKMNCMSVDSAKRGLRSLERRGMVKRHNNHRITGGRGASDIEIIWLSEGGSQRPSEGV